MAVHTKTVLTKRKVALAREIRNIKQDYEGVSPEDMPDEITAELKTLMTEMREVAKQLETL